MSEPVFLVTRVWAAGGVQVPGTAGVQQACFVTQPPAGRGLPDGDRVPGGRPTQAARQEHRPGHGHSSPGACAGPPCHREVVPTGARAEGLTPRTGHQGERALGTAQVALPVARGAAPGLLPAVSAGTRTHSEQGLLRRWHPSFQPTGYICMQFYSLLETVEDSKSRLVQSRVVGV